MSLPTLHTRLIIPELVGIRLTHAVTMSLGSNELSSYSFSSLPFSLPTTTFLLHKIKFHPGDEEVCLVSRSDLQLEEGGISTFCSFPDEPMQHRLLLSVTFDLYCNLYYVTVRHIHWQHFGGSIKCMWLLWCK